MSLLVGQERCETAAFLAAIDGRPHCSPRSRVGPAEVSLLQVRLAANVRWDVLILSRSDVEAVLDLDRLVEALGPAMVELSAGRASVPPRIAALVPQREGLLAAMPAFLPVAASLTTKLVTLFPQNRDRPTHQALICCFDPDTGSPLAVMDGTYITAARTAAGSALATRLLARRDARVLAVIGTGEQARAHVRALVSGSMLTAILVAGRDRQKVTALVEELQDSGIDAEAARSVEEAVRAADVVCTTTHADRPVVRRGWLRPGTHVNSVGYNSAGDGEVDAETVRDAVVVVESRSAALAPPPSGAVELRGAMERGLISADHIRAEIGELVEGRVEGRTDDAQLTLYKSVGVAVQDAAAAALVIEAAEQRGVGVRFDELGP